jgi:MtN3 and saliva related transmembrane protein
MSMWIVEAVGSAAGVLTTLATLPQLIKTLRTRSVAGISLNMYRMLAGGFILWILYGLLIHSFSLVLANTASLLLQLPILYLVSHDQKLSARPFENK